MEDKMKHLFNYSGYVIHIVDGDTIDVSLDLGFHVKLDVRLRLANINTAELKSDVREVKESALLAKNKLEEKILNRTVTIDSKGKDRYGRWIAIVKLGNRDINKEMITEGLAVEYKK